MSVLPISANAFDLICLAWFSTRLRYLASVFAPRHLPRLDGGVM